MSFLGLFDPDPEKVLARAEGRLERGDPVGARELAEKLLKSVEDPNQRDLAEKLVDRARQALVASTLERASVAEAAGHFDDAREWLEAALDNASDAEREEIAARLAALRSRAASDRLHARGGDLGREDTEGETASEGDAPFGEAAGDPDLAADPDSDPQARFELLLGTLRDDVAAQYADRPPTFRDAYLALNDGLSGQALLAFNRLVSALPEDPVCRLERGRCRLATGEAAGARDDFAAVWEHFGDAALDTAGGLSVPLLWGLALLDLGERPALLDRLADLADPRAGQPELSKLYGSALIAEGRLDEACALLAGAASWDPNDPELPYLLGLALQRAGETDEAIARLEDAVAPSCTAAGCGRVPLHPPSLRLLTALHLDRADAALGGRLGDGGEGGGGAAPEADVERAGDLLHFLRTSLGGRFSAEDHRLAARYFAYAGHAEAAERSAAEARRLDGLATTGDDGAAPLSPPVPVAAPLL